VLLQLSIRDIALVDRLTIEFAPGLNVLTGETGAGKSIVVGSLDFVLGGRADKDRVAGGAERGQVEALFDISALPEVQTLLETMGLSADDGLLPIAREVHRSGRSLCRLCGALVPLAQLKQVTGLLVDLHGQHAHQSLLDPQTHLRFLDAMGDKPHREQAARVRTAYADWNAARREAQSLEMGEAERARREDMLRFQLQELDGANLQPGEDDALEAERDRMRHAQRIREGLERAYAYLSGGMDDEALPALDALRVAQEALSGLSRFGERFAQAGDQLSEALYALESVADEVDDLRENIDNDPERLNEIEARLDALSRLRRKYGATIEAMIAYREQVRGELLQSETAEERLNALRAQEAALLAALRHQAEALSEARHALAAVCAERVRGELSDLGMARADFSVQFDPEAPLSADGLDRVEFLLSANAGQPLRPLARVASGGELSRIMLGLKCIEAEKEGIPVLVFDEIDTGIGGRMGQVVAEKMLKVSRARQVLCVTHLPQIAAKADAQYIVEKSETDGAAHTRVALLDETGRIEVLAHMLGGGETALAHAKAMLERPKK
jgi:DNA repair protein RecN (Recombination protein N)